MKYTCIGVVAAVWLCSQQALAAPGQAGQLALGAERLTGFSHSSQSSEDDYGKTTISFNNLHLLSNPLSGFITAYSVPRVALDYFVADGVSLGGNLSYVHVGTSTEAEPAGGGASVKSDGSLNLLIFSPRVGYAVMFTEQVGLWPRGGVTYIKSWSSSDDGSESNGSDLALTIEAPLLLAPVDNVAITVGPTIDYGLSTSSEFKDSDGTVIDTGSGDNPSHEFGVQAGLTVFF